MIGESLWTHLRYSVAEAWATSVDLIKYGRFRVSYLAAHPDVLSVHSDVMAFGRTANEMLHKYKSEVEDDRLSSLALEHIFSDAIMLHGSIRDACEAGRASVAPLLLRTQLDLMCNAGAINHGHSDMEYLALKYFCTGHKKQLQADGLTKEQRASIRASAERYVARLPSNDQARGREYYRNGRVPRYWYEPEFKSPRAVLQNFATPAIVASYDFYSGAAHGASIGMKSWRDVPDDIHPWPRRDKSAQNLALTGSSFLMLEMIRVQVIHHGVGGHEEIYNEILAGHQATETLVMSTFSAAMDEARAKANERPEG